jgi:hypothetical protein
MTASVAEISGWYDRGVKEGAAYMIVWCDTYDWEDYPAYFTDRHDAQEALNKPASMQRAMECYDLRGDREEQLTPGTYTWALRAGRDYIDGEVIEDPPALTERDKEEE